MPQLTPGETFPIVRVLENHTDTDTNYVQAVVRDATTDIVLATLNLADLGNRRFRYLWKVPYDNVYQLGRFVLITTTVYTDSGYTTKNLNYGEKGDTYLVQQRFDLRYLPAGGGVEAKELRAILGEELPKHKSPEPKPIELPAPIDAAGIETRITGKVAEIGAKIDALPPHPEPPEQVDLAPLHRRLDAIEATINALPKFSRDDLGPLIDELRAFRTQLDEQHKKNVGELTHQFSDAKMKLTVDHSVSVMNPQDRRDTRLKSLANRHGV